MIPTTLNHVLDRLGYLVDEYLWGAQLLDEILRQRYRFTANTPNIAEIQRILGEHRKILTRAELARIVTLAITWSESSKGPDYWDSIYKHLTSVYPVESIQINELGLPV
jgi:hypothetical protein